MEKWFDYKELQFNVGDTFRYFYETEDVNEYADIKYPTLFVFQSEARGALGCLEPDIEILEDRSGQYDVGQVGFMLPVRWYGYPEIYVQKEAHSAREYGRLVFDTDADIWNCCIGAIHI